MTVSKVSARTAAALKRLNPRNRRSRTNPDATLFDEITHRTALEKGLKVADATAFSLCMDNGMDMRVFGMEPAGNVTKALRGEAIGTIVTA